MTSKIKIKLGLVEVEYEGSEEFLKKELPDLLSAISKLYKESGIPASGQQPTDQLVSVGSTLGGTTGTIAAKLKVSSGSDLAVAAAARLTLGLGQGSFTRDQLLTEMKSASSYCKKNYISNLSNTLNGLVKSAKFVETAKDTYALSAKTKSDLENRLVS
jgi:hypothetical protein